MGIAPEPLGDPEGFGRGSSLFGNHCTQGLTYLYVRISSVILFISMLDSLHLALLWENINNDTLNTFR
jgi:hypothetical protein